MIAKSVSRNRQSNPPTQLTSARAEFRARREGLQVSRAVLSAITGLSQTRDLARRHRGQGRHGDELRTLCAALDHRRERVARAHRKQPKSAGKSGPTKAELERRIKTAIALLLETAPLKTVNELRALIAQAGAALHGVTATVTPEAGDDVATA